MSQAGILNVAGGGGGGSPVQTLTGNTGGAVPPTANNINVVGTGAISVAGNPGTSTLTISVATDSFSWSEQNTNFNASIQNGYYCNAALTVTLPITAGLTIGNTIIIFVDIDAVVTIKTAAGQSIQVGDGVTSVGGTMHTTMGSAFGAILELNFKPSDTTWHAISSVGSWTPT